MDKRVAKLTVTYYYEALPPGPEEDWDNELGPAPKTYEERAAFEQACLNNPDDDDYTLEEFFELSLGWPKNRLFSSKKHPIIEIEVLPEDFNVDSVLLPHQKKSLLESN